MIRTTEAYGLSFSYPAGDRTIGPCLEHYGEFSRMGGSLVAQMARGRAFLDVGANIGAFALPAARSAREVVAVEAHPGLAGLLRRNVETNGLKNIQVVHAAAGSQPGEIDFPAAPLSEPRNFGALGVGRAEGPMETVPLLPLDDLAPADLAMVKIDVEGFELEVLKGAQRLLHDVRPTWLIEYNDPLLLEEFRGAGYRTYWFWDAFVTPRAPKRPWAEKLLGDLSVLAAPAGAPQPLGMVEAQPGDPTPASTAGFDYLRAFGIAPVGEASA